MSGGRGRKPPKRVGFGACVAWRDLPHPLDWTRCFGRTAPLVLEIGSGEGEHLVRLAESTPDASFIGVDRRWERCLRALGRIHRRRVPNARVLHADVRVLLDRLLPEQSLAHVECLFPCPWPEKSQAVYRLFSHRDLLLLNSRLVDNGTVRVVTDEEPFAQWVLTHSQGSGFEAVIEEKGPVCGTRFERRWVARGLSRFLHIQLVKRQHRAGPTPAIMHTHMVEHFDPASFTSRIQGHRPPVIVREFLYDPVREVGLQHILVVDEGFNQDVWIRIGREGPGWRIAPLIGCGAVSTPGLQAALDRVRDATGRAPSGT